MSSGPTSAFFQFILIWIANKPDEVAFYLARMRGGWRVVTVILVVGHFACRSCFLLATGSSATRAALGRVAGWILRRALRRRPLAGDARSAPAPVLSTGSTSRRSSASAGSPSASRLWRLRGRPTRARSTIRASPRRIAYDST